MIPTSREQKYTQNKSKQKFSIFQACEMYKNNSHVKRDKVSNEHWIHTHTHNRVTWIRKTLDANFIWCESKCHGALVFTIKKKMKLSF